MDPASGVSFAVRRGVARDNEEVENDAEKRPWATIESCEMTDANQLIDTLLAANLQSITRTRKYVQEELDESNALLAKSVNV